MSNIINDLEKEQLKNKKEINFNVGDTIKVYNYIQEDNKKRIQVFKGICIKIQGSGIKKTFVVRNISSGIGVEKLYPIYSPNIQKIEIVKLGKVRRAKINYISKLSGKAAKIKEKIE